MYICVFQNSKEQRVKWIGETRETCIFFSDLCCLLLNSCFWRISDWMFFFYFFASFSDFLFICSECALFTGIAFGPAAEKEQIIKLHRKTEETEKKYWNGERR